MLSQYRNLHSRTCPRCNMTLPQSENCCNNCGYQFASMQADGAVQPVQQVPVQTNNAPQRGLFAPSPANKASNTPSRSGLLSGNYVPAQPVQSVQPTQPDTRFPNGQVAPVENSPAPRGGLLSSTGAPRQGQFAPAQQRPVSQSGLLRGPFAPVQTNSGPISAQNPIVQTESIPSQRPPVQPMQQAQPAPVMPIMPFTQPVQPVYPMQPMQMMQPAAFVPATPPMLSVQAANSPLVPTSAPRVPGQAESASKGIQAARRREKEELAARKRTPLLYFMGVVLVIIVFLAAGIHASGISPATFFAHSNAIVKENFPATTGTPIFADAFGSDGSGWNLQSVNGSYSVTVGNGSLTLENDNNKLLWELLPGERAYGNFVLSVNATLAKGDQNNGYGIYIRGTANQNTDLATYYRFELYGDGSYAVFKGVSNGNGTTTDSKIVDYTLSSAIQKAGKVNHIVIVANGPALALIVNNHIVQMITDRSYASGSIALFVANLPDSKPGAQVQFSQFTMYAI